MVSAFLLKAQTTETFETETIGSASFSDNGQIFNISSQAAGPFDIQGNYPNTGWSGSTADSKYIDNDSYAANNMGVQFTISSAGSSVFRLNSFYIYLATYMNVLNVTGTLSISGKLGGVTKFTASSSSGFNNSLSTANGFTYIDLASFGGSNNTAVDIDEFVVSTTSGIQYVAFDAMNWAPVNTSAVKENVAGPNELLIYPNPCNGTFTLQSFNTGVCSVVNELGQIVVTAQLNAANNFTMHIENLAKGMYFIKEISDNRLTQHKVIVH